MNPNETVALKMANLEEGQFLSRVDERFREIQESIHRHATKYLAGAEGAKAVLNVKLVLKVEKTLEPRLQAEVTTKMPGEPAYVEDLEFAVDQHGPCVRIKREKKPADAPGQMKMFPEDLRVDPATGEIRNPPEDLYPPDDENPPRADPESDPPVAPDQPPAA